MQIHQFPVRRVIFTRSKPVEAAELSRIILKSMEKSTGIKNRGVKTGTVGDAKDNYYINAHSKCTSCSN